MSIGSPGLLIKMEVEARREELKIRWSSSVSPLPVFTNALPKEREEKRDSSWHYVPKLTFSQFRIPCCQMAGMFTLRVLFGVFFFFSLNRRSMKSKKPRLGFSFIPSHSLPSPHGSQVGCLLPSRFHLLPLTPTCLSCQEPLLASPYSLILYSSPRKISQITTSWVGSCLLFWTSPHPRAQN